MAKQTFTTGQVLTAAQMTSLQQTAMSGGAASAKVASYVLVAADAGTAISMTNGGATTITVNTGLFAAGDTVTVVNLGAGVCTVTAGTATVSTSGSLVLAQNQGDILYFTSASAALFLQFATPASGDIEGVTAGTGLSGGGTSGTVTLSLSTPVAVANGGTGISSFGTGIATFLGTPSSANLAAALTDETGTGAAVFGTSPTIATPVISSPKISSTYTAKTSAYTFASGDEGQLFSMNNAATQQFNIPTDATFNFAVGTEINVFWITGAGQPTIGAVTPGTTTVISTGATSATPKLRAANSGATCKKLAANSWIVFGDIA